MVNQAGWDSAFSPRKNCLDGVENAIFLVLQNSSEYSFRDNTVVLELNFLDRGQNFHAGSGCYMCLCRCVSVKNAFANGKMSVEPQPTTTTDIRRFFLC